MQEILDELTQNDPILRELIARERPYIFLYALAAAAIFFVEDFNLFKLFIPFNAKLKMMTFPN